MNISNLRNEFHSNLGNQVNVKVNRTIKNRLSYIIWHQVYNHIDAEVSFNLHSEINEYLPS